MHGVANGKVDVRSTIRIQPLHWILDTVHRCGPGLRQTREPVVCDCGDQGVFVREVAIRRGVRDAGATGAFPQTQAGNTAFFHETYVASPGSYECVYHHMPAFGLGRAKELVAAEGPLKTATRRMEFGRASAVGAADTDAERGDDTAASDLAA